MVFAILAITYKITLPQNTWFIKKLIQLEK